MGSFITSGDLLQDRAVTVPHRLTSGEIAANLIKGCKLIVHSALGGCEAAGQSVGRGIANNNKLIKQNNSDRWQGSLEPLAGSGGTIGLLWSPHALFPSSRDCLSISHQLGGGSGSVWPAQELI